MHVIETGIAVVGKLKDFILGSLVDAVGWQPAKVAMNQSRGALGSQRCLQTKSVPI
jgi:hypothetical protein